MNTFNKLIFPMVLLLFLLLLNTQASAYRVSVSPPEINPGDAFVVKVEEAGNPDKPSAVFNRKKLHFSSCGYGCFIAIGSAEVNAEPGVHSVLLALDGKKTNLDITVKQGEFPTVHLTLPPGKVFLNPKDQERANREAIKLKKIWPVISDRFWEGKFIKPIDNEISTVFGVKRIMNKKKTSLHRGVDIRGKSGEAIHAFNRGKVVLAEELFYGGNTLVLDHGLGIYSIYMHLSKIAVEENDMVPKGQVVGYVGMSGRATGPHLHFGVKVQSTNANPLSLMELDL
jgi:murein DD-endopeptidase MepM/ murein hydrolase activator NlpD